MKYSTECAVKSRQRGPITRFFSLALMILFTLQFHLLPSAYALTVEEQAGSKAKKESRYGDEFSKKAPVRRDDRGGSQEKDPRLACLLSLMIPGGGHIYLKKDLKGVGFCLLSAAGYGASGYYFYVAMTGDYSGAEKKSKMVMGGLFFLVAAIIHVVGIVEAYNDAIEINEKRFYYGRKKSSNPFVAELVFE